MLPLWIFSEGDRVRGLGHLSRCSAYAQAWRQQGGVVHWVVDGDALASTLLEGESVSWGRWQQQSIPPQQAVAIVDSYSASLETLQSMAAGFVRVMYLDDTERLDYPQGMVVHASPGPHGDKSGAAIWRWGPGWQPLRPPFWSVPTRTRFADRVERILIIMGGTDVRDLTPGLVSRLRQSHPDMELNVVNRERDTRLSGCRQHHRLDAEQMIALMSHCDLAISAAGQVTYELARCGLPGMLVGVADNQRRQLAGWCGPDAFMSAGWWHDTALLSRLEQGLTALSAPDERARRSQGLQQLMTGNGTLEALSWLNQR
ncbi:MULTISPECIES: hypothetical protein [Aeromonas]|uniref:hypothetical protein n=1 Tax=Aeromonas TaxID=642 RepID=UPI000CD1C2F0|nr:MULTISPECIES: hypothetical protein [Aeromonas]AUV12143.1 hypothetical protein C2U39_08095 [Aeromonas sp. ASNIH3]BBQ26697.1 hypothetical protein WP2W18C05_29130 [Aeromonas sp. WP2-W18-CRE-05]